MTDSHFTWGVAFATAAFTELLWMTIVFFPLEEGDAEPGVAWGNEAKHIILKADCGNENGRISVITRWAEELLIYGYTVEKALGRD